MRHHSSRRDFLVKVGRGALAASLGPSVAAELGLASRAVAGEGTEFLSFGSLEPTVALMAETPADKLVSILVEKLRSGTSLRDLVAAGALANARSFGGEDYVGFHTLMALSPAYRIAMEMPEASRALPVLKVLLRNTSRIQESGAAKNPVLHPVPAEAESSGAAASGAAATESSADALREAVRRKDLGAAERCFAQLARGSAAEALDRLLPMVEDATEVHRVVLPYRAYDLLDIVGPNHAHTLLRQSIHYCVKSERSDNLPVNFRRTREILPRLLEEFHLLDGAGKGSSIAQGPLGSRTLDDAAAEALGRTIFSAASPEEAARAAASCLAEGISPEALGEAISLAANQLVLRDHGRRESEVQPNKPLGSVHGDSIGVHACDSANAWRNLARAAGPRNAAACLLLGAYQVALDRIQRGGDFLAWEPHPHGEYLARVRGREPAELIRELDGAIREQDQGRAAAIVHRAGELRHPHGAILDVLRGYAVSEDGSLHAEKYFRTVTEESTANRPAFRFRQLVALARVTASEYGRPAPGIAEARRLLNV